MLCRSQVYLDWSRCWPQTERSVVVLAVLAVEVEPHQAGVGVVLGLGRTLGLLGTEMSERLHFRLAVRFHLEKNYYFD